MGFFTWRESLPLANYVYKIPSTVIFYEREINVLFKLSELQFIHSLVFSLEARAWQEPEPSHVTGMALAHCILGKFLGVVCHCFPPPLDVPNLAARCLGEKDVR